MISCPVDGVHLWPRQLNLERDIERLREAVHKFNPDVVIVDPVSAYLGRVDTHRDADIRRVLAPLVEMLEQERVALLAVAHLNKDQSRAALHRPGGSVALVAAARIVLCLAADPSDPDRRVLASLKNNLAPPPASLAFRLPEGRLTWETGSVDLDADTLLRPVNREEQSDADSVIDDLLADHAAWPLEAKVAADAHGVSSRSLRRAAKRRGIDIRRTGFGKGGKWMWHRPIGDTDSDEAPKHPDVSPMAPMQELSKNTSLDLIGDKKTGRETVSPMPAFDPTQALAADDERLPEWGHDSE